MKASSRGLAVLLTVLGLVLSGLVLSSAAGTYSRTVTEAWAPNGGVVAIARHGDRVYIGGSFSRLVNSQTGAGITRNGLAALDATTGEVLDWNPGATGGEVRSIAVSPDGTVYVGGDFTAAAGQPAERLAAIGADGRAVPGWSATAADMVWDIVATGSAVYVGGTFLRVNGISRGGIAKLDPATGALDTTFNARVTGGRVRALTLGPGGDTMLLGGTFSSLGGRPREFVGSVQLTSGEPTAWAPAAICDLCHVFDLSQGEGNAYGAVAGRGGRAVAWSLSSGNRSWLNSADGDVQAIDYHDGVVYAGGHFGPTFAGAERHQLAALTASNGALLSYTVPFTGRDKPGVWAVLADESELRIGGLFRLAGTNMARYASFPSTDDPVAASAPTAVAATMADKAVRVTWAAPQSDGGSVIERYEVTASAGTSLVVAGCAVAALSCLVDVGRNRLQEGTAYRFTVRAVTASGPGVESEPSNPVNPDVTAPAVTMKKAGWRGYLDTPKVRWSATDSSGIKFFRVDQRSAMSGERFGSWTTKNISTSSTTLDLRPGETVCVRVRAFDNLDNASGFTKKGCRSLGRDDRSAVTRGTVKRVKSSVYYRGTATRLVGKSSQAKWGGVRASQARLVATSCPRCGSVAVFYGKKKVKTISLKGATRKHQQRFRLPDASTTKKIKVRPTSARKVVVDGLILQAR